jgi:ATP-dependent Clp protease ATP-binding subunit ClpC
MFLLYTENARRSIFFARYEASQLGSHVIEAEHLLLGILREMPVELYRFLASETSIETIRAKIGEHAKSRERVSASEDLPLSEEAKRGLAYGAEEAEMLNQPRIGLEHLLLGLLREENCFAAQLLRERGADPKRIRKALAGGSSASTGGEFGDYT